MCATKSKASVRKDLIEPGTYWFMIDHDERSKWATKTSHKYAVE